VRRKFRHVLDPDVAMPELPFIVPFEPDRSDQAGDGDLVREDADDIRPALDLLVQALERIG